MKHEQALPRAHQLAAPPLTAATVLATAAAKVSQELWTFGGALVQHAQEPNIPFGESLTSIYDNSRGMVIGGSSVGLILKKVKIV